MPSRAGLRSKTARLRWTYLSSPSSLFSSSRGTGKCLPPNPLREFAPKPRATSKVGEGRGG